MTGHDASTRDRPSGTPDHGERPTDGTVTVPDPGAVTAWAGASGRIRENRSASRRKT